MKLIRQVAIAITVAAAFAIAIVVAVAVAGVVASVCTATTPRTAFNCFTFDKALLICLTFHTAFGAAIFVCGRAAVYCVVRPFFIAGIEYSRDIIQGPDVVYSKLHEHVDYVLFLINTALLRNQ